MFTCRWGTLTYIGQSLAQIARVRAGWADSMDWGYESDETDPEDIFTSPDHVDYEEVESQASNEPEPTTDDTDVFH